MPADDGVGSGSLLSRVVNSEWIPPGLFFIALGSAALWISRDYPFGDAEPDGTRILSAHAELRDDRPRRADRAEGPG